MTHSNPRQPSITKTASRTFLGLAWRMFALTQCDDFSGGLVRGLTSILTKEAKETVR